MGGSIFKKQGIIKKIGFPLKLDDVIVMSSNVMNEKIIQGPLYDINVWCNRSFKTKLHPIIVRQYSHLKRTTSVSNQISKN